MHKTLLFIKLCLLFLLASSYSKADCLPDTKGLCTPGVTITEDVQIDKVEDNKITEIVTTTTTTKTTTTVTVTNEDSGNVLNLPDMSQDWGGEGPANMPSGNACYGLGTDTCAEITGSGNTTSEMGVDGMGTTFIQTVDISDLQIDKGGKVKYSIEVDKQDAEDRIYMHITGLNGTDQVFTGTDILSESGVATGYKYYDNTFDFSGSLNRITVEIGGRDVNLAVGPVFDSVSLNVFYNVINTIVTQQITTVEEIVYLNLFDSTELEFATEVIDFNDITVDDAGKVDFKPIETKQEEVTYETVEMEIQEINFKMDDFKMDMPTPPMESVELEMELELELELEITEPEIEVANIEEQPEAPVEVEEVEKEQPIEEETTEPSIEPEEAPKEIEEVEEAPEEIKEEPTKEPSAKEKAATKIVKKIDDKARYDDVSQMKTLIVMQILGNTKTFFDTQALIQDTNVNEYLNKTIEDKYAVLFNMAQEQTINDMVNSQWQK
jgi:hypothetical protein